jgi:hypothetical protein
VTRRRLGRWLLLAAISSSTVLGLIAVAGAPFPLRASELTVDTTTMTRLALQPHAAAGALAASATITETYTAVIAASPLFAPVGDYVFVPLVSR